MKKNSTFRWLAVAAASALMAASAFADEAAIRKNLMERLPGFPKIDEVSKTPIPGLYEIRVGSDVIYADEQGNHIFQGEITDTRTQTNITEARITQLSAISFAALPLKDAVVWKQGTGARKLVVFADPNCGYCKQLEHDLQEVKDVTVYTFLIPILGGDSSAKTRDIWCAKDSSAVWRKWMIEGVTPPRSIGKCDTAALDRNVELSRKHRVRATPALVFEDGARVSGFIPTERLEKQFTASRANASGGKS